jgi:hypothetical protein
MVKTNDPELNIKPLLPTFTPDENIEHSIREQKGFEGADAEIKRRVGTQGNTLLDYEEALYFGDSKLASLSRFY